MGKRTKKVGPTRGLGARYGATVRKRYIKIVTEMKKKHKCPQCGLPKVKRVSVGIWKCKKCGFTFTGGAYAPATKLGTVAKRVAKGAPVEAEVSAASGTEEE
ncbi:MAG: 50S ribosomal protein L37ae [Candidatus Bathyarchaeia archaeon]|nr:50S ribosomal protein L37ae [Candidatus Bathyarchaeota archaeon]